MGNNSSNTVRVNESITNNFLNVQDSTCSVYADANIENNNVQLSNINGSTVTGFEYSGAINATCRSSQEVTQSAAAVLQSQSEMEASNTSDWFNGGSIYSQEMNVANIQQNVLNNMLSVSVNTCNAEASANITGNTYTAQYIKGSKLTGFIVTSDVNSNCSLSNVAKQQSASKIASSVSQLAKNVGMMVAIFTALFACIAVCVIGAVFIFGGIAYLKSRSSSSGAANAPVYAAAPPSDIDDILAALE